LAERYRVICPDLRGAGWTDAPADGYARDQLLADVVALLDALEIDRVRLIGHDFGGILGLLLCLRQPERVRCYLGLGTPHPHIRFDPRLLTMMWRLWFQVVIATPGLGPRLLGHRDQRLPRHLLHAYLSDRGALSEADVEPGHEGHADDLRVEFVDGASHFIAHERPDAVVERALEFFAKS